MSRLVKIEVILNQKLKFSSKALISENITSKIVRQNETSNVIKIPRKIVDDDEIPVSKNKQKKKKIVFFDDEEIDDIAEPIDKDIKIKKKRKIIKSQIRK